MITRVVMPKLTDTMEQGVLVEWKKQEGDAVVAGDVLAEIETDKAVMDLEAFGSGTLRCILVPEGETVDAGALLAVIAEEDEDIESALSKDQKPEPSNTQASSKTSVEATESSKDRTPEKPQVKTEEGKFAEHASPAITPPDQPAEKHPVPKEKEKSAKSSPPIISPRAKALAEKSHVDWTQIKGSGPGGRIVERDILKMIKENPAATAAELKREAIEKPLSQMRKAIARITTQSKSPVPHFYLTIDISMREAEKLQTQLEETAKKPFSLTVLILKAVTEALKRHPEINVSYAGESLRHHQTIDIGIAVALPDGLINPVVRDCAKRPIHELADEMHRLVERAKNRQLTTEEYTGATFSISNLGMYGIENFIAVLMPPQAASLAVGAVQTMPVIKGKKLQADRRMKVTLSCDHRALDGAQGARFLQTLKEILENPLKLVLPPM